MTKPLPPGEMLHAPTEAPSAKHTIEVPAPVQMTFDRKAQPSHSAAFKVVAVTPDFFNGWTGRRYLDGVEWHGPVLMSDNTPYTGARACPCSLCQQFVRAECRPRRSS